MRLLLYLSLMMSVGVMMGRGDLPPPEKIYKILMLLPASSKSHRNVFMPVAEALADRGHKIVMLANHPKPSRHPNIYEVDHGLPHFSTDNMNMFEERKTPDAGISMFKKALPGLAQDMYNIPKVKDIFQKRKDFDLIVINHMFNEIAYPFAYEMPFITIATPGMDPRQSAVMGNPISPAYIPAFIGKFDLSTVFGRLKNTLAHISVAIYWRHWAIVPLIQKEIDVHFPGFPSLNEIERNQSLTLMNSHFSMDLTVPLLPNQIEVGAMHCKPAQPLPKDIQSWIDGAGSAGVIYFSLGSVARGDTMPVEARNMFIEAFKRMKQRILWKFETELEGVSKNVLIRNWLPQQDILAHPNVKVFISHGGMLSTQESSYHGTPLLVVPIFGDQPKNAEKVVSTGLGLSLDWEELTVDIIVETLQEIISNPKYQENVAKVSILSQDQLESPIDRAVFWTEYVIRHNGAPKLRSPAADLSWVQFLLLDALAILLLIIVTCLFVLRWIVKKMFRMCFGKKNKKKKRE